MWKSANLPTLLSYAKEKQYWLKPEKNLDRAIEPIENVETWWEEIDVYEPMPGFDPESYYSDNQQIKEKWQRHMEFLSNRSAGSSKD